MDTQREAIEYAIAMLKRHEGYRRFPYRDTRGILTIAHGRNLEGKGISELEAGWLLMNDAEEAAKSLASLTCWSGLSPARQAALIDLTVNLGYAGVLEFKKMLAWLDQGCWLKAAAELQSSLAETQEHKRIGELAALIQSGEFPT